MSVPEVDGAKRSYTLPRWERLQNVCRVLRAKEQQVATLRSDIEWNFSDSQRTRDKNADVQSVGASIVDLERRLETHRRQVMTSKAKVHKSRMLRDQNANDSLVFDDRLAIKRDELADRHAAYIAQREQLVRGTAQLLSRRRHLMEQLQEVYPITSNSTNPSNCSCQSPMYIANIHLPDAENMNGHSDTDLSVAMGYVVHILCVVSRILDLPLRYPCLFWGSRSAIEDKISPKLTTQQQISPLFPKGQERLSFEYGVFLLNKNIGQLRSDCMLTTSDLRRTLSNVKSLLDHLCANKPSRVSQLHSSSSRIFNSLESASQSSTSSGTNSQISSLLNAARRIP